MPNNFQQRNRTSFENMNSSWQDWHIEKNGLSLDWLWLWTFCQTMAERAKCEELHKFNICIYQCAAFVYKQYIHFIFLSLCSIVRIYILPITVVLVLREQKGLQHNTTSNTATAMHTLYSHIPTGMNKNTLFEVRREALGGPGPLPKKLPPAISVSYFYQLSSLLSPRGLILEYELTYRLK